MNTQKRKKSPNLQVMYSKEEIEKALADNETFTGAARELGMFEITRNPLHVLHGLKFFIEFYKIDFSTLGENISG